MFLLFKHLGGNRLKIKNYDVTDSLAEAKKMLAAKKMDQETRAMFQLLITLIELMASLFGANSKNSSKPPSQDPHREKPVKEKSARKAGGQPGSEGRTLEQTSRPDEVVFLGVDRRTLPRGESYTECKPEKRQVFDVKLSVFVTEYQAEVLVDGKGRKYVAPFPTGVTAPVQYGSGVRSLACYLSCFQMLPFERLKAFFNEHLLLPISTGTLAHIRADAAAKLEDFEKAARIALLRAGLLFCDETGINVAGKNRWIHCASSTQWTLLVPHEKRGKKAADDIGVLGLYQGIMIHDNWPFYFKYTDCSHALCNAHQIRELTRISEDNGKKWAAKMIVFLQELNKEVQDSSGKLTESIQLERRKTYREILASGEKEEPRETSPPTGKRGRQKQTKSRNLLDRLITRENETLLFMTEVDVPFTNNQGERDQRMTKVKQKVSGTYKTLETAKDDARIRSFISTCTKHGVSVADALNDIFRGKNPDFVTKMLQDT